jgi:hypothetical protein
MAILVSQATATNTLSLTSTDATNVFYGSNFIDKITYTGSGIFSMLDVSNGDEITVDDPSTGFRAYVSGNTLRLEDSNHGNQLKLGALVAGESVTVHFSDGRSVLVSASGSGYTAESGDGVVTLTGTTQATEQSVFATPSSTATLTAAQATALLNKGLDYSPLTDVTVNDTGANLATLAPLAHDLGGGSITLNATDNAVSLTLLQASDTLAYGGVAFAASDVITVGTAGSGNPMALLPSLVGLGVSGTQIKMDVDVDTSTTVVCVSDANTGAATAGNWHFETDTGILAYWNSAGTGTPDTILLTGVTSVAVSGAGLITLTV